MRNYLLIVISFFSIYSQGNRYTDSLALVALYNATGGDQWTEPRWDLSQPIDTYAGVVLLNDRVHNIALNFKNLQGNLPVEIGNITELIQLSLQNNPLLTGPIPSGLSSLTELRYLNFSNTNLSGTLSTIIESLDQLLELRLSNMQNLTGPIPDEIANLTQLQYLDLHQTDLGGSIPESIANLDQLTELRLNNTNLSGTLPPGLGNLTSLVVLSLSGNAGIMDTIPDQWAALTNLEELDLNSDNLSGELPTAFVNLSSLEVLNISNNKLTGLPDFNSGSITLSFLFAGNNRLTFADIEPNITAISDTFEYADQDSVESYQVEEDYIFVKRVAASNQYQWYQDGQILEGGTSDTLDLSFFDNVAGSSFYCRITNTVVNDLTLYTTKKPIKIHKPTIPQNLTAIPGYQRIKLIWSNPPAETSFDHYLIYSGISPDNLQPTNWLINLTDTSYMATTLFD
ncbi:MAG: hypothetical protein KDD94_09675, partial [Calditrichaeota bacterium]|nr:hypothetical protein [Calditrichota bacterium]